MPEPSSTFAAFAVYAEQSGLYTRLRAFVDALCVHRNFSLGLLEDAVTFGRENVSTLIAWLQQIGE